MDLDEELGLMSFIARWWLWGLVLVAVAVIGSFLLWKELYPKQLGVEREAVRQSLQFTESLKSQIVSDYQKWMEQDTEAAKYANNPVVAESYRTQQRAIALRMQDNWGKLPQEARDALPPDVQDFLKKYQQPGQGR